jgi:hypothetical protein
VTDLDPLFMRELRRAAEGVSLPAGDLPAVVARSTRLRHARRRLEATSLMLAMVILAGVVSYRLSPAEEGEFAVSATAGALRRGETGVVWRHGNSSNALDRATAQALGGTLYAVSTAPGAVDPSSQAQAPKVLYRSTDGVDWSPVEPTGGASFLADLSVQGDRLYAVGTTTASVVSTTGRPVADLSVHLTDDGARTWQRVPLAVDLAGIAAKSTMVQVGSMSIAAGDQGVVAVAGVTAQLDLAKVLPAGVSAANGWAMSEVGVDLLGTGSSCPAGTSVSPERGMPATTLSPGTAAVPAQVGVFPCYRPDGTQVLVTAQAARGVERSFTWAELGVAGDLLQAVRATPMAFWSPDGVTFERVDAPLGGLGQVHVAATAEGFAMVAQESPAGGFKAVVLRSADGRRWSRAGQTPDRFHVAAAGHVEGRLAVLGGGPDGPGVALLDGGAWRTGNLADVIEPPVKDKASTSLIGGAVGPLGMVAVVAVGTGRPAPPPPGPAESAPSPTVEYQLLFSRDGLNWSAQSLNALVGGPVARIGNAIVTESRIIVTVIPPGGDAPPDHATVVVGTI